MVIYRGRDATIAQARRVLRRSNSIHTWHSYEGSKDIIHIMYDLAYKYLHNHDYELIFSNMMVETTKSSMFLTQKAHDSCVRLYRSLYFEKMPYHHVRTRAKTLLMYLRYTLDLVIPKQSGGVFACLTLSTSIFFEAYEFFVKGASWDTLLVFLRTYYEDVGKCRERKSELALSRLVGDSYADIAHTSLYEIGRLSRSFEEIHEQP